MELSDRVSRRATAAGAWPDSTTGRFSTGLGGIGTLGLLPLRLGDEEAQQSLRASAAKNKIYSEVASPDKQDK